MNHFQKGIVALIKSAILGIKVDLPKDLSFSKCISLAKQHEIAPLLFYGAVNCGLPTDNELLQELFPLVCKSVVLCEGQLRELSRIADAFSNNGIDYLPLKGAIIRELYPKPEMRRMGDADILIKVQQYNAIERILRDLGFVFLYETDHEIVWKSNALVVELHKKLVPERNVDFFSYFGTGWCFAIASENNKHMFSFSLEHTMIFIITHFAKHYRGGGIGLQHAVDIWLFTLKNQNLDNDYIISELKKLKLDKFYINILDTIDVWFNGFKSTEITDLITDVIFESSAYGTKKNHNLARSLRASKEAKSLKKAKLIRILNLVFPSCAFLIPNYPILKRFGFLLPIIWVVRWFKVIFFRNKQISIRFSEIKAARTADVFEYQQKLNKVGLDYYSKEKK